MSTTPRSTLAAMAETSVDERLPDPPAVDGADDADPFPVNGLPGVPRPPVFVVPARCARPAATAKATNAMRTQAATTATTPRSGLDDGGGGGGGGGSTGPPGPAGTDGGASPPTGGITHGRSAGRVATAVDPRPGCSDTGSQLSLTALLLPACPVAASARALTN